MGNGLKSNSTSPPTLAPQNTVSRNHSPNHSLICHVYGHLGQFDPANSNPIRTTVYHHIRILKYNYIVWLTASCSPGSTPSYSQHFPSDATHSSESRTAKCSTHKVIINLNTINHECFAQKLCPVISPLQLLSYPAHLSTHSKLTSALVPLPHVNTAASVYSNQK